MQNINQPPPYIKDLIIKFLEKEASPTEVEILEDWLKQDEKHRKQFDEINDTFQAAISLGRFTHQKTDHAWKKLSHKINETEVKPITLSTSKTLWLKIAATVLVIVVAGIGLSKFFPLQKSTNSLAVVQNAAERKTKAILPDGSIVWLNVNSSVEYDADFGKHSRLVSLRGEAFFDVKKGKKDFIVRTDNLSIQVKGTRFNVNTDDLSGNEKTTLEEGHVVLQINGSKTLYEMIPGDQIAFNRTTNKVFLQKVNPSNYSAWKEAKLIFDNALLADIVKKLENRFKVTIAIDDAIAQRERLTMTIENETIDDVLEFIELSSRLHYRKEKNQIMIFE